MGALTAAEAAKMPTGNGPEPKLAKPKPGAFGAVERTVVKAMKPARKGKSK